MRNWKIVCAWMVVGFTLSFAGVSFAADASQAAAKAYVTEPFCKVSSCDLKGGKVLAKIHPSAEYTEVGTGQSLNQADSVKTDACSSLILEFPNKSTIYLQPNTEITIEELVWNDTARKVGINMTGGQLRTIIKKVSTPSEFKIRTPMAVCGARGTIFYVRSSAAGTSVYTSEDSVDVFNPADGNTYTVPAGMMLTINSDGTVVGPVEVSDMDLKDWTECYTDTGAEPYTPPEGGAPANVAPPEVTQEGSASAT